MPPLNPQASLPTHEVLNMPPHLGDQDLWAEDIALQEAVTREGGEWAKAHLAKFGNHIGQADMLHQPELANNHLPELKTFDRYGMRVDQVEFHPAYHALMTAAIEGKVHSFAWNHAGPGAHVAHGALTYMYQQIEGGVMCPMAMAYPPSPRCKPRLPSRTNGFRACCPPSMTRATSRWSRSTAPPSACS
jgi:putative acyl-CoA dehydrogenase